MTDRTALIGKLSNFDRLVSILNSHTHEVSEAARESLQLMVKEKKHWLNEVDEAKIADEYKGPNLNLLETSKNSMVLLHKVGKLASAVAGLDEAKTAEFGIAKSNLKAIFDDLLEIVQKRFKAYASFLNNEVRNPLAKA